MAGRLTTPDAVTRPERPASRAATLDAFDAASDLLVAALAGADDDLAVWTWADDARHAGFVRRRQAHEALIHRIDAELASGRGRSAVDPHLAADGVDEALRVMFGGLPPWAAWDAFGPTGRVAAHDVGRHWTVRVGTWSGRSPTSGTTYESEPGLSVVDTEATADAAFTIAGTAADLDAWLWSRPTIGELVRVGDTSALDHVVALGIS